MNVGGGYTPFCPSASVFTDIVINHQLINLLSVWKQWARTMRLTDREHYSGTQLHVGEMFDYSVDMCGLANQEYGCNEFTIL